MTDYTYDFNDESKYKDYHNWEKPSGFKTSKQQLIKNVLSDKDGKPYPWFDIQEMSADYTVDWETPQIIFSAFSGPMKNITAATHELGHLMIAKDEGIGQTSWGMRNIYVFITGLGIDPGASKNMGQIKNEAKAWAWQYLIECMADFREHGSPVPKHSEARYIEDGQFLNRKNEVIEIVDKLIQKELNKIYTKYPDGTWKDAIKNRMGNMGNILNYEKQFQLDFDDGVETNIIAQASRENGDQEERITLYGLPNEWFQVLAEIYLPEEGYSSHIEEIAFTRDEEKAIKYFNIALNNNEMEINNENTPSPSM